MKASSFDLLHHPSATYCSRACLWDTDPLFSTYPLLGTHLLTTYTHKRICLLTRVYSNLAKHILA